MLSVQQLVLHLKLSPRSYKDFWLFFLLGKWLRALFLKLMLMLTSLLLMGVIKATSVRMEAGRIQLLMRSIGS